MRRALPFVAAGVVVVVAAGLVAAFLLMGDDGGAPKGEKKKKPAAEEQVTQVEGAAPEEAVAPRGSGPRPSAGSLRPMNEGEIENKARLARPLNQHVAHVSAWWGQAQREVRKKDPEMALDIEELTGYLRDQTRRNDDTLDVAATIERELAVEAKIRAAHGDDPRLSAILDYVKASAEAVKNGEDPTKVPKPDVPD